LKKPLQRIVVHCRNKRQSLINQLVEPTDTMLQETLTLKEEEHSRHGEHEVIVMVDIFKDTAIPVTV
jgi:hypothetical protein